MGKRKQMCFRLPADLMQKARAAAESKYQTLTDFIVQAVLDALKTKNK